MYFRGMKKVVPGALVEVAYTLHADGPDGEELEVCTEEAPFMFRLGEDEALERPSNKRCLKSGKANRSRC